MTPVSPRPIELPRRADRTVTEDSWIAALLHRAPTGYLATIQDDQPFINSNLFAYDQARHALYMHTARVGRTRSNIEAGEADEAGVRACFTATEIGRLLPSPEALEFSVEYAGVVVFGRAYVVHEKEEARDGLQQMLDKYAPHLRPNQHYRPIADAELRRTSVYRIEIESWSGKRKAVDGEPVGAYLPSALGTASALLDEIALAHSAEVMAAAYQDYLREPHQPETDLPDAP